MSSLDTGFKGRSEEGSLSVLSNGNSRDPVRLPLKDPHAHWRVLKIMGTAEAKAEAGARPPAGLLQLPHALNSSAPLSEASRPGTPSTSLESRTRGRALSLLLLREPQARHAHLPSVHKKGAPDISEGLKMATADLAMPASPEAPRTASVPTGEVYKPQARAL